jgi:cellulose biosynthesis protein BcsQ
VAGAPPDTPTGQWAGLRAILAIASNKGGVGKTTLATNLAIYLRALQEEQPVCVIGLDDQGVLDRMFSLRAAEVGDGNLMHGWAERSFDRVIRLGQYGVHYVPPPPDVALLKARAEDPKTLRRILARTEWSGIFLIDTKADLEALTRNAVHAADRVLVPVADWASLEEAAKIFRMLERDRLPIQRARVVFTLVDRRSRVDGGQPLYDAIQAEVARRDWPRYQTFISRSPRVETLNSASARPLSILHHARGTAVHGELRDLADEILRDLAAGEAGPPEAQDVLWGRSSGGRDGTRDVRGVLRRG